MKTPHQYFCQQFAFETQIVSAWKGPPCLENALQMAESATILQHGA